jgi:hypothetical protein
MMATTGQQALTEQMRLNMIPQGINLNARQQLMKMPDQQFRSTLQRYLGRHTMQNPQVAGAQPSAPVQAGMMSSAQAQALQMGMPSQLMAGPGMAVPPGMPLGQQTPNGMVNQQMPMGQPTAFSVQQQQMQQASALLQQNPGIIPSTDNMPFNPSLLTAPMRQALPPNIKSWAQLKAWANQNPQFHGDAQRIVFLQVLQFQAHLRQQQRQRAMATGAVPQPNGAGALAPPAQMTPGQPPMRTPQQQPNMPTMALPQMTPQEIQSIRQKLPPNMQNYSDDQIRSFMMARQNEQRRKMQQQKQQQMQMQAQAQAQAAQTTPSMPAAPQPMQRSQSQAQQHPQGPSQQKPAPKPSQPAKAVQNIAQNTPKQGVKRPNEDTVEVIEPPTNAAPQAPAMAPSRSQQGIAGMTPEQISKLSAEQQAQMRVHLLKAQDGSNPRPQPRASGNQDMAGRTLKPEDQQKYKAMIAQEEQSQPHGQPVPWSPESRARMQQMVMQRLPFLRKADHALCLFLVRADSPQAENSVRQALRSRCKLYRNINNGNEFKLRDQLTLSEDEFRQCVEHLSVFVQKLMHMMTAKQQGQQSQSMSATQPQPGPPAQLTPANLAINDQQQRQQKPPPAPVSARPPFPIGAQSPRGAPTYFEGARDVKDLKLPEKKKPRLDAGLTAPPKQSPLAGTGKDASPAMRPQAPPKPVEQQPQFRCPRGDCEYSLHGFHSQNELDLHIKEDHAPVEDPVQFAVEGMADAMDVDVKTGQYKAAKNDKVVAAPNRMHPQPMKPGQTPSAPQNVTTPAGQHGGATPMARVATLNGLKSSPSTNLLKTPQTGAKAGTPSTAAATKATPSTTTKPAVKETGPAVVNDAQKGVEKCPVAQITPIEPSLGDIFQTLDANGPFTVLDLKDEDTAWVFRADSPDETPEETPESINTPSTRNSDISENDILQINASIGDSTVKDLPMPDAWLAVLNGDVSGFDATLSNDLSTLGVSLPDVLEKDQQLLFGGGDPTIDDILNGNTDLSWL